MTARFKYYRYYDHPKFKCDNKAAIHLFKSEINFENENRIKTYTDDSGIAVYEDELNLPLKTREKNKYNLILEDPIMDDLLAGKRYLERYSFFKIQVDNYSGDGSKILVSADLTTGEKFIESVKRNKGWDNYQRYINFIVCGIKQKCIELEIADLHFKIIDLEYNFNTSCHTSQYAVKVFIDKYVVPKLVSKASA